MLFHPGPLLPVPQSDLTAYICCCCHCFLLLARPDTQLSRGQRLRLGKKLRHLVLPSKLGLRVPKSRKVEEQSRTQLKSGWDTAASDQKWGQGGRWDLRTQLCWFTAVFCTWAFAVGEKDGFREEEQEGSWHSKLYCFPEVRLFSPGPPHMGEFWVRGSFVTFSTTLPFYLDSDGRGKVEVHPMTTTQPKEGPLCMVVSQALSWSPQSDSSWLLISWNLVS